MSKIEVKEVYKTFGSVKAINGLNLTINRGEVCAFLGHNGAGKTTTLRLLLGLLEPDRGEISVFGFHPAKEGDKIRELCGVLSEDVGLYEPLTVYDNLIYYADIHGIHRVEARHRIDDALEQFEISDKKNLPVKGFSTGMKKKVALIRAMLNRPKLLLLDEPTNGLDPVSTKELREMLITLAKESGATIVLTTHNLDEVQKICDQIIIFRHGKNIFSSKLEDLQNDERYWENGAFSLEMLYMKREGGA